MQEKRHPFDLVLLSKHRNEIYGFSILWIMLFHSYLCSVKWSPVFRIITIGNMGCEVFLFLSGISLYFAFIRDRVYTHFIKRRLIRVLIPAILISFGYWIYELVSGQCGFGGLILRFTTLEFWVEGNQQIWFVSLIILAYLLYPLINRLIFSHENIKMQMIITGMICIFEIALVICLQRVFPTFYKHTEIALTRLPAFTLGCFFGKYVYEKKRIPIFFIFICVVSFTVSFIILTKGSLPRIVRRYFYIFGGVPLAFILAWIFEFLNKVHFGFINRFLSFFGGMTIELYVVHIIAINLYKAGVFGVFAEGRKLSYLILMLGCVIIAFGVSKLDKLLFRKLAGNK